MLTNSISNEDESSPRVGQSGEMPVVPKCAGSLRSGRDEEIAAC
jgi:hypothetical protein